MDAAREHFLRVGFDRAVNREIAAQAGVTGAAIYQHFSSKAELFVAVASEAIDELVPRLREVAEAAPSARAALVAIVKAQWHSEQEAWKSRFLASVPIEMQRNPEVAQALVAQPGTFFALILDVVRRGVREGEIAQENAERVLALFIAAQIGLSIHSTIIGGPHSRAAIDGFLALLEGELFASRAKT